MSFSASSATVPKVTIIAGCTSSIVRRRKSEQFLISFELGRRFAPDSDRGLQRAALVIKISSRRNRIDCSKRSKFLPDWSPEKGTRVRSAPLRPGASPMNMTRASRAPFTSLKTAARSHIAGQLTQVPASAHNEAKRATLSCDSERSF
jgi:hypothetical protein